MLPAADRGCIRYLATESAAGHHRLLCHLPDGFCSMVPKRLRSINDVDAASWDALLAADYPFLCHGFLRALEDSGAVCAASGWEPAHRVVEQDGELLALMPLYRKSHSWGEYVFDWQWAEAWERAGQRYYPKYLSAAPFSPVQGPRLIARDPAAAGALLGGLDAELQAGEVSSLHLLFNLGSENDLLQEHGWLQRLGCQFHWYNRDYQCFDDFLAACNSRKRKNFRKERQAIRDQGIEFRWLAGEQLDEAVWRQFYPFYAATYYKRGQEPYLPAEFFILLNRYCQASVRLLFAMQGERPVAGALFLVGGDTLYGRYWGCLEEFDRLHFETCFYQGMERCIAEGLKRFDAGAQGEHKLVRGFEPVLTQSWHKLQPGLHGAVADFLLRERAGVKAYQQEAISYLPFRQAAE